MFAFSVIQAAVFASISLIIGVHDARTMHIPNHLSAGLFLGLFTCSLVFMINGILTPEHFLRQILFSILSPAFFMIIRLSSKKGLGLGDVKYSAGCGFFIGNEYIFIAWFISALICGLWILFKKKFRKGKQVSKEKSEIPFGPFMAAGILITKTCLFISISKKYY